MKFGKRISKLITLVTALLLSSLVIWVFASYIADRQIKISYEITPSVTGHYRLSAFFTDGKNQEVNRGDGNKALGYEKDLTADTPTVIEFKKPAGNTRMIEKTELLFEYLTEPRNDVSVEISDIVINHWGVDELYVKSQNPERTLAEKCRADGCKGQETDSYNLKLTQSHTALYLHEDLGFKSYYTHFSVWPILIIIVVSTGLFYKLIRTILNIRRHQETRLVDVVFILMVVATLFVPTLRFKTDHNMPLPDENRMAADYKPLLTGDVNHPVNLNWTRDFENWFNDRFGDRGRLIGMQKQVTLKLNHIIEVPDAGVCQTVNNWCISSRSYEDELGFLTGTFKGPLTNAEYISKIARSTDLPIYVLIYPLKTEIYPDKALFINNRVMNSKGFSAKALEQLSTVKEPNVHVIDLTPIFKQARQTRPDELLYFVDEHHPTEIANKLVLDYLAEHAPAFRSRFPSLDINAKYPPELVQFASGDSIYNPNAHVFYGQTWGNVFGHANRRTKMEKFEPHSYLFYSATEKFRRDVEFKWLVPKCNSAIDLHNKSVPEFKVYMLGNSFIESLSKMTATIASDVYRRRINDSCGGNSLKSESVADQLKALKPDVVLMPVWTGTFSGMQ